MSHDAYFDELTKHMMYSWDIAQVLGVGVHSYAHHDAELFELGHELGSTVQHAFVDESMGFGALFDLSYEIYLERSEEEARLTREGIL